MHTFGEKSSFFNLTDGYAGRFIGWLPFAEALQHPLKAVYRFLRRCDLHLPAGGEYPAVEIAAEINGRLHSEVVLVHNQKEIGQQKKDGANRQIDNGAKKDFYRNAHRDAHIIPPYKKTEFIQKGRG